VTVIPDAVIAKKPFIDAWTCVTETGMTPGPGAAATVTVLRDGAGYSIGLHQATDRSDAADAVLLEYISMGGAYAARLEEFVDRFTGDESVRIDPRTRSKPRWAVQFEDAFTEAGLKDPLMREAQERVFDREYWMPAANLCVSLGLELPLTYLIVYDAAIQSGLGGVTANRNRFKQVPPSRGGDEIAWSTAFLAARHSWLCNYRSSDKERQSDVRRSSYRTAHLAELVGEQNWGLVGPVMYRNHSIG
jgi:hypothetical protein